MKRWYPSVSFQAEDGIRDLGRSRGLGDVYKRQQLAFSPAVMIAPIGEVAPGSGVVLDGRASSAGSGAHIVAYQLSLIHI